MTKYLLMLRFSKVWTKTFLRISKEALFTIPKCDKNPA